MRAIVWKSSRQLALEEVEDARIEQLTDVLLRVTSTAIAFLASENASFLVGSVVMADGGMSVVIQ